VTLLFALPQWQAVSDAYLRGLERRTQAGDGLAVASVASFFISRIDAKANDRLPTELHNRLAVASAQLAYAAHQRVLTDDRWQRLAEAGARPQRLLWASTSTKDPALPETFYVQALAAPDTVNTMPEDTLLAFARSGEVDGTMPTDGGDADTWVECSAAHEVELEPLGAELQDEGDQSFADAFDRLLACIAAKADALQARTAPPLRRRGPVTDSVTDVLADLTETRSLLEHFWSADLRPEHFAVITDPGTPLAQLGRERGFRAVFEARPDIGGRYAALSHFGLVPAALAGVDVAELLHRAGRMAAASATCVPDDDNAGLQLAATLAGAARTGRDKLTLVIDGRFAALGAWIEQLIAESTGKQGLGIVPIVDELATIRIALRDRHRVATTLGVGPRYLHSTGQLHKGGPNTGVFLQVVDDTDDDLPIPGEKFGFATLERAQAAGDLHALIERGRRAGRVELDALRKA
jgi:hypothetical protein